MKTRIWIGLLVAVGVGAQASDTQACGWYCGCVCYQPVCCYPCWPCHQPDTSPLNPVPTHPHPGQKPSKLTLQDKTYSEAFVIIYILHPDGVYRMYEKIPVPAGKSVDTKQKYFQGDHLLIDTWSRGTPTDYWHCHCRNHLITVSGDSGTFDVIHCHYTHP